MSTNHLPCSTIKQWEEAGASLMSMLKHYKSVCLTLAPDSLSTGARPKDLVARILSAFEVHVAISQQLIECTSALQKVRNKLVPPFFRLPEEIILKIFLEFVYGLNNTEAAKIPSIGHDVRLIYRRLYSLIGVCSGWKRIAVSGTKLWWVIPMGQGSITQQQHFQLSLQRARASKLYLVASNESPLISSDLVDVLTKHCPRFHAINISAHDPDAIRDALDTLTRAGNPGSLAKLALRVSDTYHMNSTLPQESYYIIPRDHPQLDSLTSMLQGLTSFHNSGALIRWDMLAFSTRLVELWINDIMLGYDDKIIPFIQTLSSATELRDLKIISVTTVRSPAFTPNMIKSSSQPARFPNLQSLFVQDIYFNTLLFLLPHIAPGSHRLTLFLTPRCLKTKLLEDVDSDDDEVEDSANVADLCKILESIPIDTLMLSAFRNSMWLTKDMIHSLLEAMPALKTLKFYCWTFDQYLWEKLSRSPVAGEKPEGPPFPALENLHLTLVTFHTTKGFQEMVASHPLRRIVFGGAIITEVTTTYMGQLVPLQENSLLVEWLRDNVPEVYPVDKEYRPMEFYSHSWRLW